MFVGCAAFEPAPAIWTCFALSAIVALHVHSADVAVRWVASEVGDAGGGGLLLLLEFIMKHEDVLWCWCAAWYS